MDASVFSGENPNERGDEEKKQVLRNRFDFAKQQIEHHMEQREALWVEHRSEYYAYSKKVFDAFLELSDLLPQANIALRRELELGLDEDKYLSIQHQARERGRRIF